MKAISRFLIVCLLMVSATGFGTTTADLDQNSKDDMSVFAVAKTDVSNVVDNQKDVLIKAEKISISKNAFISKPVLIGLLNDDLFNDIGVFKPNIKCNYHKINKQLIDNYNAINRSLFVREKWRFNKSSSFKFYNQLLF